ncbi:hypothetical protein GGR50DRAFT_476055 [Xylaria sp. CBS 124048]|nr:hypothetical protein GGR50DRAFT_476055 [Xylaria sp. CBS 124048]
MTLPEPVVALTGGCTVIFNNTLYSYSPAGFQSLKIEEGAVWKKLPAGQSVEGGVCVGSTPGDVSNAGFFVVGGKASQADYPGLQKFTYAAAKWETITPQVAVGVTKDRVDHSATYLNSTESLLVYAGSTDDNAGLSQQTFTISTSAPYRVLSFQSDISPAGVAPLLLPWSGTQAALIGGSPLNTQVVLFDTTAVGANGATGSWVTTGITLAEPLPKNTTLVKGAIIQGDDGSKHLYTFDPTTSPNTVNRTVLVGANGQPVTQASPVAPKIPNKKSDATELAVVNEREIGASNWPPYNSTLAPKITRTDYSIATDPNGLVVISGGNQDDAFAMFNAKANSWEDASAMLDVQHPFLAVSIPSTSTSSQLSTSVSSTATSPAPATSAASMTSVSAPVSASTSASATATPAPAKSGLARKAILGITLGSVFAAAILLAVVLVVMRYRKRKPSHADAGHARRASGMPQMDFATEEDSAQIASGHFRGHGQQQSHTSFSSMAMFLGKPPKPTLHKGSSEMKRISGDSVYSKEMKQTISRPQPQTSTQPAFLERTGKAPLPPQPPQPAQTNLQVRPTVDTDSGPRRSSGWNRYWSGGSASIMGISRNSKARPDTEISYDSSQYSDMRRLTQDSETVPTMLSDEQLSFHQVSTGSPTISQYAPTISEGLSGHIEERPVSPVSGLASSRYSSGIPASPRETWSSAPKKARAPSRATSSAYSSTIFDDEFDSSELPPLPSNRGVSRQPQLAVASVSTDMSWLNLGDSRNAGNGHSYR